MDWEGFLVGFISRNFTFQTFAGYSVNYVDRSKTFQQPHWIEIGETRLQSHWNSMTSFSCKHEYKPYGFYFIPMVSLFIEQKLQIHETSCRIPTLRQSICSSRWSFRNEKSNYLSCGEKHIQLRICKAINWPLLKSVEHNRKCGHFLDTIILVLSCLI